MDPDQTALGEQSALDLHCLFKRLHNISIDDKNIRLCCNIRFINVMVYKCGFSALTDRTFMKCTQTCAAQATFKRLTNG